MAALWERIRTPLVVVAGAAILALTLGGRADPLPAGQRAPAFEVETSEGAFRLGQPGITVVNFWGSYCGPCRAEAPVLSAAHRRLASDGGRVLGISTDRAPLSDVLSFARRLRMRYPIAVATDEILARYKVDRLPTTYVVRPDGRIAESFVGAISAGTLGEAIRSAQGR